MTVKISNLPAATSVGSGDVLPVVQSGTTKKIDLNSPWSINIDGGNIDGTPIGVSSASSGAFTNLSYNGTLTGGTGVVNLGSGQIYKDATGNLGLGTTAPESRLVASNVSNGIHIKHNNVPYLLFENTGASGKRWGLNSTSAGALGFYDGDIGSTRMTIAPSGNVGIGTTSPVAPLHVQATTANTVFYNTFSNAANRNWAFVFGTTVLGDFNIVSSNAANGNPLTAGTSRFHIRPNGDVGIGTTSPTDKITVTGGDARVNGSSNVFLKLSGAAINEKHIDFYHDNTLAFENFLNGDNNFIWRTRVGGLQERMRIDSSGRVLIGTTSAADSRVTINNVNSNQWASATLVCRNSSNATSFAIWNGASGWNAAQTVGLIATNSVTGRSLNAAGTLNASGTDYAEYMTKCGDFNFAKGDIVGIDTDGQLTNVFSDAVSFAVKSTDPSFVGGDSWGVGYDNDEKGFENARQKVDRIAFAGQVPVNVYDALPGQYIIPINDNGSIKGKAISDPTFEQYQIAVGKVIAIDDDGRARIIVKIA